MLHLAKVEEGGSRSMLRPVRKYFTAEMHRDQSDIAAPLLPAAAFDLLRMSVMLTDGEARLLYANRQARHLLAEQRGLRLSMGKLSAANPKCAAELRGVIRFCAQTRCCQELPLGIAVPIHLNNAHSIAAWVYPAAQSPTEEGDSRAVIFIRSAADLFSGEVFASIFGATLAEIRVLKLLFIGLSIEDVCAKLGLSRNTVRTHLKSLFAKTGTRRQVELIGLAALAIAPASTRELDVI
jgi:DNA-binding CsgD family transcriptional regulator